MPISPGLVITRRMGPSREQDRHTSKTLSEPSRLNGFGMHLPLLGDREDRVLQFSSGVIELLQTNFADEEIAEIRQRVQPLSLTVKGYKSLPREILAKSSGNSEYQDLFDQLNALKQRHNQCIEMIASRIQLAPASGRKFTDLVTMTFEPKDNTQYWELKSDIEESLESFANEIGPLEENPHLTTVKIKRNPGLESNPDSLEAYQEKLLQMIRQFEQRMYRFGANALVFSQLVIANSSRNRIV